MQTIQCGMSPNEFRVYLNTLVHPYGFNDNTPREAPHGRTTTTLCLNVDGVEDAVEVKLWADGTWSALVRVPVTGT